MAEVEGTEDVSEDNPYVADPDTNFRPVKELDRTTAEQQVERLRESILFHDYRYYVRNDPVIADRTYDALFDRLDALEEAFDLRTENSPTQRVGGEPVDELRTVEHVAPMLSIDSSGEADDVREFDRRVRRNVDGEVQYVCEPKFDGLSIEVVYVDGEYERAATRGDGRSGEDVTENVRTIESIPLRLRGDHPDFLAVRGEIYMPRDAFQAHNRERVQAGEDAFANPRNAAVGTLRQLDPSVTAERPLDCFFYDVLAAENDADDSPVASSGDLDARIRAAAEETTASAGAIDTLGIDTHWDEHEMLPDWGLKVNDRSSLVDDIEDAIRYRDALGDDREALDYEIDGVVYKVNDREQCAKLGTTSRHYRWAYAYKFPARTETTRITDVVVQVGRTGRLTPVALLEPVDVGGVTVSRASLHNQEEIAAKGVGVGDEVRIQRAGDVIPYVAEVVDPAAADHFRMPEECPVCGSEVEFDGPIAFCTGGLGCPAQLKQRIAYFAGDGGLDVEGIGEETADEFVERGLVERDLADLYDLTEAELVELAGWGETSARNLLDELDASKRPSLPAFLSAIGIPEVGPTTAQRLAEHFGSLDAVMAADESALRDVEDVGPTVAALVREFFDNERNREAIERLRDRGVDPRTAEAVGGDELAGLTFVFTGSVEGWSRAELEELIERHGGAVTGSVSGNTDYLVVGANPGRTKREDAADRDVPEIDHEALFDLLAERGVTVES